MAARKTAAKSEPEAQYVLLRDVTVNGNTYLAGNTEDMKTLTSDQRKPDLDVLVENGHLVTADEYATMQAEENAASEEGEQPQGEAGDEEV